MTEADDLLDDLVVEALDHIEQVEPLLMAWEREPELAEEEQINQAFRSIHTIKGNFGFVGLNNIKSLAHALENLLTQVRETSRVIDGPLTSALIDGVDSLRTLLEEARSSDQVSIDDLLGRLITLHDNPDGDPISETSGTNKPEYEEEELTPDEDLVHHLLENAHSQLTQPTFEDWELSDKQCQDLVFLRIECSEGDEEPPLLAELPNWGQSIRSERIGDHMDILFMTMADVAMLREVLGLSEDNVLALQRPFTEALERGKTGRRSSTDVQIAKATAASPKESTNTVSPSPIQKEKPPAAEPERTISGLALSLESLDGDKDIGTGKETGHKSRRVETKTTSAHNDMLRLPISLVDHLMALVGELVLSRNKLHRLATGKLSTGALGELIRERYLDESIRTDQGEIRPAGSLEQLDHALTMSLDSAPQVRQMLKEIDKVTRDLQGSIMQMRLQPVAKAFNKANRLVRQVARDLGKEIELELVGEETELDKGVIEAIADPLTHLLRNACDHGVEAPEIRQRKGKPRGGTITLAAAHEGDNATITISDDGGGIDYRKILAKAVEKGLIDQKETETISEAKALDLLFVPGLSTAEQVSQVSGRGVGMDVVRTNIERLGGSIHVTTELGKGSVFTITIPLTLSIINALLVTCGEYTFALSQSSLTEIIQVKPDIKGIGLEKINNRRTCNLRGHLIPLIDLPELTDQSSEEQQRRLDAGYATILIVECDGLTFGIVIDDIVDSEEVVVKRLSPHLAKEGIYNGATILGDGQVAMIIDLPLLLNYSGINRETDLLRDLRQATVIEEDEDNRQRLLLVEAPDGGQQALPVEEVVRMDRLASLKIEKTGDVANYQGEVLPLLWVAELLPERRVGERRVTADRTDSAQLAVIVERCGRPLGIIVHRLVDLNEETIQAEHPPSRKGVSKCLLVRDRVTELLDIDELVRLAGFERFIGVEEESV